MIRYMGLEDDFDFGVHKGKQLEDVIHDHPDYISWIVMEGFIGFDEEASELISKRGIV